MTKSSISEWLSESVADPKSFWENEAGNFSWHEKWSSAVEQTRNGAPAQWFAGGVTNICGNALDRHALGSNRGKAAIIWESAEKGESRVFTYWHLMNEVLRCAGALKNMGVMPGDRVLIYLPMLPEAVIAVLACSRIGAVFSTIWPGAGVLPLTVRLEDLNPRVIVTADGFLYKGRKGPMKTALDQSIEEAKSKAAYVIVLDRKISDWKPVGLRDISWSEAMEQLGENRVPPVRLDSSAPSSIVYTSGATARPRGFVRDTGGTMVALQASMRTMGIEPDDIVMSTADLGAPNGVDDAILGPLLIGATSIIYEGLPDHPTPGAFWDAAEKHGATVFSCPTADLSWLRRFHSKWIQSHDLKTLRHVVVSGEPLHDTVHAWATDMFHKPIIEQYRLAEFTTPVLASTVDEERKLVAGPGFQVDVILENDKPADADAVGRLVVNAPYPPGMNSPWRKDSEPGKEKAYFETGDMAKRSEEEGFKPMGRLSEEIKAGDEVIGSRIIEEIICSNFVVAEAAVVQDTEIAAFVVVKDQIPGTNPLKDEIRGMVEKALGEAAAPKKVMFVKNLPRTPSGKSLRRTLRALLSSKSIGDLSSIRNPDSLPIIRDAIKAARL